MGGDELSEAESESVSVSVSVFVVQHDELKIEFESEKCCMKGCFGRKGRIMF